MSPSIKTTKQLLRNELADRKRKPLYNAEALDDLKQRFSQWQRESVRPDDRENWQTTPQMVLG